MMLSHLRSSVSALALLVPLATYGGIPVMDASAQQQAVAATVYPTPQSVNPPKGKWGRMRPSSFDGTKEDALRQCYSAAAFDAADRLTPELCTEFERQLNLDLGQTAAVADGMVHDLMNARENGQSIVKALVEKSLGRVDVAVVYDLGSGVYIYHYTGHAGVSCNNIAVTFGPIEQQESPPPPPPPLPASVVIINHPDLIVQTGSPGLTVSRSGMFIQGLCPPNKGQFIPGSSQTFGASNGFYIVPGRRETQKGVIAND